MDNALALRVAELKKNGDGENRIHDLTQVRGLYSDAKRALYQLSYVPNEGDSRDTMTTISM